MGKTTLLEEEGEKTEHVVGGQNLTRDEEDRGKKTCGISLAVYGTVDPRMYRPVRFLEIGAFALGPST